MRNHGLLKAAFFGGLISCAFGYSMAVSAQTALQQAQDEAAIEKAKADAAESRAKAKKSELDLQQAEAKARLDLDKTESDLEEKKRSAFKDATKSLSDLALKGEIKDVTVSGNPIESRTLTHRALAPVAGQLMLDISRSAPGSTVILADEQLMGVLPLYYVTADSLKRLSESYKNMIKQARIALGILNTSYEAKEKSGVAAFTLALQGIAAVGSLVQLFKTQFALTSVDFPIDNLALHGALVNAWRCLPGSKPTLVAIPAFGAPIAGTEVGNLVSSLSNAQNAGLDLEIEMTLWLTRKKAELPPAPKDASDSAKGAAAKKPAAKMLASNAEQDKKAKEEKEKEAKAKKERARNDKEKEEQRKTLKTIIEGVEEIFAKLKAANQRVDSVMQALTATSDKQPVSSMVQMVKVEKLADAMNKKDTVILNIKVVGAGGNTLATNNFWTGPKLFHSGGVIVAYTLIRPNGSFIAGGNLDAHTGYIRLNWTPVERLGNSWENMEAAPTKLQDKPALNAVCPPSSSPASLG